MMGWKTDIFNNFIKLNRGFDLPEKNIIPGEHPVVASTSVKAYHKQYQVNPPCVVTGRSGSLGSVQFISKKCWPLNTTLYAKDYKGNYPRYVYYFLKEMHLENFNSGAGVPTLNQNHLHKLKIRIPTLPIQKRIAAILSAYDELIAKNNSRIAILEKMAEELYREWFVRLRFPGHEKLKIVKGVPEGWEVKNSLLLLNVLGGGTPKTDIPAYWDGEIPFFTPKDAHDGYFADATEKNITPLGLENCNSKLYEKNTIFITARGTVGKIVLAVRPMAMNQSCYALEPKCGRYPYYFFLAMRNTVAIIKGTSNSGVFDNIITDSFKQFDLFQPPEMVMDLFEIVISPVITHIETLVKSSSLLKTSRDRLLPRLVSGKINVENLDIQFPASMKEEVAGNA
jgi:type I restriction enzyme, S subunit